MTTSRMGIMGNFLLSNFSLGFDNSVSRLWSVFGRWSLVARHSSEGTTSDKRPTTIDQLTCRFLDHGQRDVPLLHHLAGHFKLLDLLLAGQTIHQFQHELFED